VVTLNLAIITPVHSYHKADIISDEYMITKKHKSRMYNMKYKKVLTSGKMKISRADHEEAGRKRVRTGNC